MNTWMWWGMALGAMAGAGLALMALNLAPSRRKSMYHLVAHSVADISPAAYAEVTRRKSFSSPQAVIRSAAYSWTAHAQKDHHLELDLHRMGDELTVVEFRARQLAWSTWAVGLGLVAVSVLGFVIPINPAAYVAVPGILGFVAFLGHRKWLSAQARKRMKSFEEQLPAVWEFLSLSLSAGENLFDALMRIARIGHGSVIEQLQVVVHDVQQGTPLAKALDALSQRFELPALSRGIEQILTALHRGTPVVSVLQAHAKDAREDAKRRLLEAAGQKEVVMLIPLVFLILPVTIIFAVFPGLLVIQAGF